MNRSEFTEIRKLFKYKEGEMAAGKLARCMVDIDKKVKGVHAGAMLSEEEEALHKYLDISKKSVSNKNMDIAVSGDMKKLLEDLSKSLLGDNGLLKAFYDKVSGCLPEANYAVILSQYAYDVPLKTKDNIKNEDASWEVFSFFTCAFCPIKTTKGTLGWIPDEGEIKENPIQMVVSKPAYGFMYPAFNERTADYGHISAMRSKDLDLTHDLFGVSFPESADELEKKPVSISGDKSFVRTQSIDGTMYYLVAVDNADIKK